MRDDILLFIRRARAETNQEAESSRFMGSTLPKWSLIAEPHGTYIWGQAFSTGNAKGGKSG
jgi:hypothetical protein